jgi:hypothetical protein
VSCSGSAQRVRQTLPVSLRAVRTHSAHASTPAAHGTGAQATGVKRYAQQARKARAQERTRDAEGCQRLLLRPLEAPRAARPLRSRQAAPRETGCGARRAFER